MLREPYRFDTEQIWQVSRRQIVASGEGHPHRQWRKGSPVLYAPPPILVSKNRHSRRFLFSKIECHAVAQCLINLTLHTLFILIKPF